MSSQASTASKRPKLHPLRQTSFPANSDANAYASAVASARSESGSVVNSTFSTISTTRPQPRGRGRPRKSLQVTDDDARAAREGGSTTGAKNSQAKSVVSAARSGVNAEDEADDDEDEELEEQEGEDNQADEQKREDERLNVFLGQLTKQQAERYTYFRSSKLKDSVVKRIVNQTVSQSVTSNAVHAVQFFSKAFAIELIERAREVQTECAKAADIGIEEERRLRRQKAEDKEKELADKEQAASQTVAPVPLAEHEKRVLQQEIKRLKDDAERYLPNKHKGGLLPDHLREALRRYKSDGDGNGFGFDGLSHPLLGVRGSNSWRVGDGSTGQRLFR